MSFATAEEFRALWPQAQGSDAEIEAKLRVATAYLRSLFDLPVVPSGHLGDVLMGVVVAMVKRSMLADSGGNMQSTGHTAGPFSETVSYRNSEGNLYITAQEREVIQAALAGRHGGMRSIDAIGG
ncbi:hypothetical protein [Corynebacterium tapiri]|uniref:Uncharacterized protein n=1 Tax=Corynebacterium tapiri TaxID=1448266 RepID=A0A5C4U4Q6_9CORY|nr:hypothetical protein [Corynebacterium tapiri]TNL98778.1 hypothetical protein FHE74_03935 [Corynebacterium tapiri]